MSSGAKSGGGRVFLVGGGWDGTVADVVHGPFLRAAAARSGAGGGSAPRILCVLVDEGDGAEQFARYDVALRKAGECTPVPLLVPVGGRFDVGALSADVDGVLVCGGLTPAYQEAFAGESGPLSSLLVERGVPYAGFSAGAAVAARDAVVGGWLVDGVAVCPPDAAEDLEEVEVRPGLGLVPFGVDVHAAQWGTLGRLVAVVAGGRLAHGVAIDENTLVEIGGGDGDGRARVAGLGLAHSVRPAPGGGVVVRSYGAGESFPVA
ncbi:hypothetical protein [Streptomyces sp. NBC_01235]|uniref:hypothetical protein n=1 Tax=Streptomyces sp. NBC_01235 TaxID=2903788 RepID=UPI002E0FAFE0|nr:hypothetical protein OG289_31880 [Streptomyces sp. NBC_01235]